MAAWNSGHDRLWVVLADGGHARVVVPSTEHLRFGTRVAFDATSAHQASHDLGANRPGRSVESNGISRHAITPRQDPHQAAEHDFLIQVAHEMEMQAEVALTQLVLIAPVHALHDLQEALGPRARSIVVGSLARDLDEGAGPRPLEASSRSYSQHGRDSAAGVA